MVISKESMMYSLRNLNQRKARSLLTILSIFVGITTIFIFISFGWGLYDYMGEMSSSSSADKVMIQAKGGVGIPGLDTTFKLTEDDVEAVRKTSGVYQASGVYFGVAEVQQRNTKVYTFIISYDPKEPLIMDIFNIDMEKGRELSSGDNNKVVLGYNYLIPEKVLPSSYDINQKIEVDGEDLKIVGFYESVGSPQDDAQMYVTNDYFEEAYGSENLSYGYIIAKIDTSNVGKVVDDIEKNLRKQRGLDKGKEDFFVQSFEDMLNSYASALNIVVGFVVLIALISVLVSAVNTANTMVTSVLERVKEIGVIKSIGARNSEVLKIFLFESAFLGFIAGVVGVLIGWGLSSFGGKILADLGWGFLSPHYSITLFVGCILFATVTGAISGVAPAINASKINPVEALRYA